MTEENKSESPWNPDAIGCLAVLMKALDDPKTITPDDIEFFDEASITLYGLFKNKDAVEDLQSDPSSVRLMSLGVIPHMYQQIKARADELGVDYEIPTGPLPGTAGKNLSRLIHLAKVDFF